MVSVADNEDMFAIAFILGLLALCILAGFYSSDSRHTDEHGHRHRPNI